MSGTGKQPNGGCAVERGAAKLYIARAPTYVIFFRQSVAHMAQESLAPLLKSG